MMGDGDEGFECLGLGPERVSRQRDPAAGCAPACLEMVLDWEQAWDGREGGARQVVLMEACQLAGSEEPERRGAAWRTSPAAVCSVINARCDHRLPTGGRPHHYHVVHGAARGGPLQEVLRWLHGIQLSSGRLRLPSMLLTRHGAHWMLAVGARVDADGLRWLAVADPGSGRLVGLTSEGVEAEFSANLVGSHPDWYARHVAVVPSVLPRRGDLIRERPPSEAAPVAKAAGAVAGTPAAMTVEFSDPCRPIWPAEVAMRVLDSLTMLAREARDPVAAEWLAPLGRARWLAPAEVRRSGHASGEPLRVHILDHDGLIVAEAIVGGVPATLWQFWVARPMV